MRRSGPTGIVAFVILMVLQPASVMAGDAGRETVVTSLGVGARALGMGGGFTSMADDATAVHYNPAGLANLMYQEFAFMHTVLFEGTTYDFGSWVYPISEHHGIGGGIMRLGTDDIIRRVDFTDRGRFDYSYTQLMLAYGRDLGSSMSLGGAIKIVHQSLDNHSDFGVGVDAGMSVRLSRYLHVGAVLRDLARPELKLADLTERLPTSFAGGLALRDISISPYVRLSASCELEKSDERTALIHTGAELTLHEVLALRMGYDRDNLAFGTGISYGRMKFDYAYKLVDWVSDIHQVSISLAVGMSIPERKRQRELALLPPEPTEEEKRLKGLLETANRFFHRFQLDSAKTYFQMALDMDPTNQELVGTLAAIEESRRVQEQQAEALRAAREDATQTLKSFVAQAQQLLDRRMYRASLDLLDLIFDIDPTNDSANILRNEIIFARAAEISASLKSAEAAAGESRWAEAIEAYNRVLELDPDNTKARASKQRVLAAMDLPEKIRLSIEMFERGNLEEARTRFDAILEVNPNEPIALEYLRRISEAGRVRQEQPSSTLADLQKDGEYWELYLEGLRQMRNKEYKKAIEAWEKVLKAYPNNQSTINNIEQARLRISTQESEN